MRLRHERPVLGEVVLACFALTAECEGIRDQGLACKPINVSAAKYPQNRGNRKPHFLNSLLRSQKG
jgi:hypothetical protein